MLSLALALLSGAAPAVRPLSSVPSFQAPAVDTVPRDTTRRRHSVMVNVGARKARVRPQATAQDLATAYRDPHAREVIARARAARVAQDSSLLSYDARSTRRISAGMSLREGARSRLMYRSENAWHVRWQRGVGARVDVLGAREVVPMVSRRAHVGDDLGDASVPYFPGREGLLFFSGVQKVNDTTDVYLMHPLDANSEAGYRFASGDSTVIRLPDGSRVRLVEVRVEARRPEPDLLVGSLWFDESTGQLVRAAFRPSVPLDLMTKIEEDGDERPSGMIGAILNPMVFSSDGFFVEYGLHRGRWWLPHSQGMEGMVRVGMMRVPLRVEERFDYADVNGTMAMAPIALPARDTAAGDSLTRRARRDSMHMGGKHRPHPECAAGQASRTTTVARYDGTLPMEVTIPCDTAGLLASAELPGSIYTPDEALFDSEGRRELESALGFGLQPGWAPGTPRVTWGIGNGLLRYNRVEGLAPAIQVDEALGRGYSAMGRLRVGMADLTPTGELALSRTAGSRSLTLGAYRRLNAANDWGDPLGLGSSLSALVLGHDDGFYYRSWGAELKGRRGPDVDWRLFGERQGNARRETTFSFAKAFGSDGFEPNITADRVDVAGASFAVRHAWGDHPGGLHMASDSRLEGALGRDRSDGAPQGFGYLRGMTDLTATHALTRRLDGALTVAAGGTSGAVPVQRLWYLGGAYTVRGQPAGAAVGNAFWLGRAEVGSSFAAARPVVFYDVGWAGDRDLVDAGKPLQGVGAGVSFLDGMVRFDLSRGLSPRQGFRGDLYLEARF